MKRLWYKAKELWWNELRGRLEKDNIGAIKDIFKSRLEDTRKIDDREERLRALIRLHKELDI
jgi:hypothetical protein